MTWHLGISGRDRAVVLSWVRQTAFRNIVWVRWLVFRHFKKAIVTVLCPCSAYVNYI